MEYRYKDKNSVAQKYKFVKTKASKQVYGTVDKDEKKVYNKTISGRKCIWYQSVYI